MPFNQKKIAEDPFDRIIQAYEDYKNVNDILLDNFLPNNDYSLEYLQSRDDRLEAAILAIRYAKEYVNSKNEEYPNPPIEQEED